METILCFRIGTEQGKSSRIARVIFLFLALAKECFWHYIKMFQIQYIYKYSDTHVTWCLSVCTGLYCNSSLSTTHHFQMWTKSTKSDSSIRKLKVIGCFQTKRFEAEMRFDIGGDVLDLSIIATITIPQSSVFDIFASFFLEGGVTIIDSNSWTHNLTEIQFPHRKCCRSLASPCGSWDDGLASLSGPMQSWICKRPSLMGIVTTSIFIAIISTLIPFFNKPSLSL